jgi:translation initiation factor IF-2
MRTRGANVTDIIIIVVAADDGVKAQTEEVISHAKASGCPIIVAMNKMDKESANPDMVKAQMAERNLTPVDWGGDIEFIGVSARTGEGVEELLENILIQAELLELKADPTAKAKATVIEASLEKGRGPVANVIVQNGTLRVGDNIVCDTTFGRVKAITNDMGEIVKELGLSETGTVLGLNEVPTTGSSLISMDSEKEVREIANTRAEHARAKELSKSTKVSLEEMSGLIAEGKMKQLPVIIKADVGGSLEAIKGSLEKIANDEVKVKVVHAAVGGITESDIVLASASSGCIILGFNVRPTGAVKAKAKADGVEINTYSIIYDLLDDVKNALSGMMSAVIREENTGQAEVRDTFVVPKVGTVAGCLVTDGKVIRGGHARIIRDGVVTYTGKISSLKRFKDDVKEVANGYECGIMFDKFNDIKVGDFIETFIQIEEKVSIDK